MESEFNLADYGYTPNKVSLYGDSGWIVTHSDLPTLVIESGTGWHCILPDIYNSEWMPQARALFG